ncbi:MAG: Phenylalanyl-tRNA synthetase alpha chain [Gemmatimonadetes bacterium]|nr:Phenylalanyl-tRNA synthetase alpha chain [Gemmatimonadota bacterium]
MMTIDEFRTRVESHKAEASQHILGALDANALEEQRTHVWSRTVQQSFSKALGELPADDRREAGRLFNELKVHVEAVLESRRAEIASLQHALDKPKLDLTMPARARWRGGKHPVTLVIDEIVAIFRELGFTVALGPESESEWYNFSALNFPADHPAMDMHDTFYLGEGALLRTHTSPVQIRTLQSSPPPIRILAPGTVFRRDPFDASHAPAFAQVEGLAVDEGISFVDLKATLTLFAQKFFGKTRTRFRPSYFPFTEPSAEMDVECRLCGGRGCSACKGTGWMEILGSGMVHPSVLEAAGIDSERYTGWAFGMGPGRIAMLRYGLPDIRLLYDSDIRFLEQVAE